MKKVDQSKIERINQLAKKKKSEGLTDKEAKEQKELYKEYLASIRMNVTSQLDNMVIEDKNGAQTNVKDLRKKG